MGETDSVIDDIVSRGQLVRRAQSIFFHRAKRPIFGELRPRLHEIAANRAQTARLRPLHHETKAPYSRSGFEALSALDVAA
jgi:hypothetical protein